MRIGIYIESVKASHKTGVSRYVIGLVEALLKEAPEHQYYLYYQKETLFSQSLSWLNDKKNVHHRKIYSPTSIAESRPRLWWDYVLPFFIWKDKLDLFHGPNHFTPRTKTPTVLTIHDLAYYFMEVHGAGLDNYLKSWTDKSMKRANKILTVSESTKKDCHKQGIALEKLQVVYQGFEGNKTQRFSIPNIIDPYILFLGTIQPRKNVARLIEAFSQIAKKIPHRLILAGAPGECFEEIQVAIDKSELNHRVEVTGFITDEERESLYLNASCFVYPSKYEGFGLVALEAMSYGVPVVAANNSSLPEAVGEAGILVDDNALDLGEAIEKVVCNSDLAATLVAKGLDHIKRFTWSECAKQTLEAYRTATLENKRS